MSGVHLFLTSLITLAADVFTLSRWVGLGWVSAEAESPALSVQIKSPSSAVGAQMTSLMLPAGSPYRNNRICRPSWKFYM